MQAGKEAAEKMIKPRLLGAIFAFAAAVMILSIVFTSCSNPDDPTQENNNNSGLHNVPTGYTVAEQLACLRRNARSNGVYNVWVRSDETLYYTKIIRYLDRHNITVRIQSYGNIRRTLSISGNRSMFQVQHSKTLILQNIVLQGHGSNQHALVNVSHGAALQMNNNSVIRGNLASGVGINGGVFTMRGNTSVNGNMAEGVLLNYNSRAYMYDTAQIHDNHAGVGIWSSTLTMRGDAAIHNNHVNGGVWLADRGVWPDYGPSFLFMHGNATIRNNTALGGFFRAGGVSMLQTSHLYMYENASILNNISHADWGGGGGVLVDGMNSTLNMHGDNVRISGNTSAVTSGGGVRVLSNSQLNISGGLISGSNGGVNANMGIGGNHAVCLGWGSTARTGHYTPNPNSSKPGTFIEDVFPRLSSDTTVSRIGGVVTW